MRMQCKLQANNAASHYPRKYLIGPLSMAPAPGHLTQLPDQVANTPKLPPRSQIIGFYPPIGRKAPVLSGWVQATWWVGTST